MNYCAAGELMTRTERCCTTTVQKYMAGGSRTAAVSTRKEIPLMLILVSWQNATAQENQAKTPRTCDQCLIFFKANATI